MSRSIVMLAMSYAPEGDPLATLATADAANISVYARHRDYHDVMKGKLKELAGWIIAQAGGDVKVFVDTAPVMEKPLAAAAGLGWQGRHTNLVSRDLGSWFFLGSIFTTLEIEPDAGEADHCGSCRACLDACPTQAFPAPYQLDARRCISYLTIEHKGPIPAEFRAAIGNRVYGCDDCLAVCPWNKFAVAAREAKLIARADLVAPDLADLLSDDEAAFRARFAGNPVKRVGHARFLRNLLIAAGNSKSNHLLLLLEMRLTHESPLVRGMAVWALARLAPERLAALSDRAELEDGPRRARRMGCRHGEVSHESFYLRAWLFCAHVPARPFAGDGRSCHRHGALARQGGGAADAGRRGFRVRTRCGGRRHRRRAGAGRRPARHRAAGGGARPGARRLCERHRRRAAPAPHPLSLDRGRLRRP
jgi:epoxyqueuosine reductase